MKRNVAVGLCVVSREKVAEWNEGWSHCVGLWVKLEAKGAGG